MAGWKWTQASPHHGAIVKVFVETERRRNQRHFDRGTGTLISVNPALVMTAEHVVDSGGTVTVEWRNGFRSKGWVVGTDDRNDLAVIRLKRVPKRAIWIPVARLGEAPKAGDKLEVLGYGDRSGRLRRFDVKLRRYIRDNSSDHMELTFGAIGGDSGGAIVLYRDGRHKLVGVLWGSVGETNNAHGVEPMRGILGGLFRGRDNDGDGDGNGRDNGRGRFRGRYPDAPPPNEADEAPPTVPEAPITNEWWREQGLRTFKSEAAYWAWQGNKPPHIAQGDYDYAVRAQGGPAIPDARSAVAPPTAPGGLIGRMAPPAPSLPPLDPSLFPGPPPRVEHPSAFPPSSQLSPTKVDGIGNLVGRIGDRITEVEGLVQDAREEEETGPENPGEQVAFWINAVSVLVAGGFLGRLKK